MARKKNKPTDIPGDPMADHAFPPVPRTEPEQAEPVLAVGETFDLALAPSEPASPPPESPPVAEPAPAPPVATAVPVPSAEALLIPFEERMRRLEEAITRLHAIQTQPLPTATLQPPHTSIVSTAQALVDAGRQLLPSLRIDSAPRTGRFGPLTFLRDVATELQAIYFMYVDPRYRPSWYGRILPLVLLGLFLTSSFWLKYLACGALTWMQAPIELVLCYFLFKIVTQEARVYRQNAPDLPAHLRL
ncbi:MAG: hypothetical protein U0840_18045 [Gemmataceae bacterium]